MKVLLVIFIISFASFLYMASRQQGMSADERQGDALIATFAIAVAFLSGTGLALGVVLSAVFGG